MCIRACAFERWSGSVTAMEHRLHVDIDWQSVRELIGELDHMVIKTERAVTTQRAMVNSALLLDKVREIKWTIKARRRQLNANRIERCPHNRSIEKACRYCGREAQP